MDLPKRLAPLPYARHEITDDDRRAVDEVLAGDWLTTGPKLKEFEEAFAHKVGAKYAVGVSSGTAALHCATVAVGLGPGDEAITTPLTFCATANSVLYAGAKPVLADISPQTLTIDPDKILASIGPKTKAIMPVDFAGHPADYDAILPMAKERGLKVIQDACHSLGGSYKGRPVGSLADVTVFSFHPVKHITTGEGGMAVTNDPMLAEKMRKLRSHGIDVDANTRQQKGVFTYDMASLGFNYRLGDMQAALGLSQLKRLDQNIQKRIAIAGEYGQNLKGVEGLTLAPQEKWAGSAWHLYPVRVSHPKKSRDEILQGLRDYNIFANVHYPCFHLFTYYRQNFGYKPGDFPEAEKASASLISLPMYHAMEPGDATYVAQVLKHLLGV